MSCLRKLVCEYDNKKLRPFDLISPLSSPSKVAFKALRFWYFLLELQIFLLSQKYD